MFEVKIPVIDVIIPAFNEEGSIAKVIAEIPSELVREVIVANNGSTDRTKEIAQQAGAKVIDQNKKGYGNACLKAMEYVADKKKSPEIIVFLDGDYSDYPEQLKDLIKPIVENEMDLVIGSRAKGEMAAGSMTPQQIFGNWLATNLIKMIYGYEFTDLGPFRAIRYSKLLELEMADKDFGWTAEMQVKAAKQKFKCIEVPVDYRKRIGVSKVSGTVKGTILAGHKILWMIFKNLL